MTVERARAGLASMLRVLFGDQNVAMIESDDPVKDMFNGWTLNRQLGFIHELVPDRRVDPRFTT